MQQLKLINMCMEILLTTLEFLNNNIRFKKISKNFFLIYKYFYPFQILEQKLLASWLACKTTIVLQGVFC